MATLPRLAVFYEQDSASMFEVYEAAGTSCRLVWVIGWSPDKPSLRAISKLGEVVDLSGMNTVQAVECLAAVRPDGVFVFGEAPLRLAAAVAERLAIPFHSRYTARLLTDKLAQRVALAQAGVPGPEFWPVSSIADPDVIERLIADVRFPVVLKPQTGTGSRNTFQVDGPEALAQWFIHARYKGEDMLIEEVLRESRPRNSQRFADVLMVDSVVSASGIKHFSVAGHFIPAPPFRGTGSFIPSHLTDTEIEAVFEATDAAIAALGVEFGFTNTDLILTPEGPRVLEVNGRIGGQIPALLTLAGANPLLSEAMRFAVRESDGDLALVRTTDVAFCAMYQAPLEATRLVELCGLDIVAQLPGVTRIVANRIAGDDIDWRVGTMSRLFTVYGVANGHDHLYELYGQILQSTIARYD